MVGTKPILRPSRVRRRVHQTARCLRRGSRITLLSGRERPCFHGLVEACQGLQNAARAVEEGADELRTKIRVQAQQILKHQYLSVTSRAGADADGRNTKAFTNFPGKVRWHALEHDRKRPKFLESGRLPGDISRRVAASALYAKASIGANGLRLQPGMAHHRDAALDPSLNYILMSVHALELNCVCAGNHQYQCQDERRSRPLSERKKWHVRDDEFARCAAHDCLR